MSILRGGAAAPFAPVLPRCAHNADYVVFSKLTVKSMGVPEDEEQPEPDTEPKAEETEEQ